MTAGLRYTPVRHDENFVHILNGAQSVRYCYGGPAFLGLIQGLLYHLKVKLLQNIKSMDNIQQIPDTLQIASMTSNVPYVREMTTLLNRPPSQKWIREIDPLCCPIHAFMLFLDELTHEKDTKEVSLRLVEFFLCVFAVWKLKIWS